jgi:hypothetical protein
LVIYSCQPPNRQAPAAFGFRHEFASDLAKRFKIIHATVQIEVDPHIACALAPDEVV